MTEEINRATVQFSRSTISKPRKCSYEHDFVLQKFFFNWKLHRHAKTINCENKTNKKTITEKLDVEKKSQVTYSAKLSQFFERFVNDLSGS